MKSQTQLTLIKKNVMYVGARHNMYQLYMWELFWKVYNNKLHFYYVFNMTSQIQLKTNSHCLKHKQLFIADITRLAVTRRSEWIILEEICCNDSHGFSTSANLQCIKVACLQRREFVTMYQTDNKSKTCCVPNTSKVSVCTSRTRTALLRSRARLKPTQSGHGLVHSRRARGDTSTHFSLTAAVRVPRAPPGGASVFGWNSPQSLTRLSGLLLAGERANGGSTGITWQYWSLARTRRPRRRERARVLSFPAGHERRKGGEKENETAGVILTAYCRQGALRRLRFEK